MSSQAGNGSTCAGVSNWKWKTWFLPFQNFNYVIDLYPNWQGSSEWRVSCAMDKAIVAISFDRLDNKLYLIFYLILEELSFCFHLDHTKNRFDFRKMIHSWQSFYLFFINTTCEEQKIWKTSYVKNDETTLPLQKEARILQYTKDESLASFPWCLFRITHNYHILLTNKMLIWRNYQLDCITH